jgi:Rps23 Pro-64 3,4-dihydroxylase Tpa1-like proline 4-hydroxylase
MEQEQETRFLIFLFKQRKGMCIISTYTVFFTHSDHLLCHDDRCEDRRIAFILYLSEHWQPDYGGSLELFDTDGKF